MASKLIACRSFKNAVPGRFTPYTSASSAS
jgi:hypothetical protein